MYKFLIGFDYKLKYSPGRCSGFQVTGMMKGFIWVWNLWFWDFLGRIICQVFFMLEIMFWGCYDNLKIYSSALTVYFCDVQTGMCCCWCLGKCLVKGFFGVVVGSPRDVFGFCFLPQLDHPCHLKSWVTPPLGSTLATSYKQCHDVTTKLYKNLPTFSEIFTYFSTEKHVVIVVN